MVYSNAKEADFKKYEKSRKLNDVQYYYARFDEKLVDGIYYFVEEEIDHKPTNADYEALAAKWLEKSRNYKSVASAGYAKSDDVRHFVVNENNVWIDSDTRVSLAKAVADKRAAGRDSITIYMGGVGYLMSLDQADEMLSAVEVYASDCFEVTENHKSAIAALQTQADVDAYDYTANYPEVLSFTFNAE